MYDEDDKEPYSLIQSYVRRKYFVSTAYRKSSVSTEPPVPWFFETIVWEWDEETRHIGKMLYMEDSGSFERKAFENHFRICEKLITEEMI